MTTDNANRKKRTAGDSSENNDANSDHRKRRRNRTTQSCLNCHASKRMCDRKRPACQRCTNLGLTGSCVYEIDDPSQRDRYQDDRVILRNRVAELEGVIREMKNKPHPRWFQKLASLAEDSERAKAKEHEASAASSGTERLSPPASSVIPSVETKSQYPSPSLEIDDPFIVMPRPISLDASGIKLAVVSPTPVATPNPRSEDNTQRLLRPPQAQHIFTFSSPLSSASSAPSPISDISPLGSFAGSPLTPGSPCLDVNAMLSPSTLDQSEFEDNVFERLLDQIRILRTDEIKPSSFMTKSSHELCYAAGHCGCLDEDSAYTTVLELSIRLRKAVEALRAVTCHDVLTNCTMFEKVADLDRTVSNFLNSTTSPSERRVPISSTIFEQELLRSSPDSLPSHTHSRSNSFSLSANEGPTSTQHNWNGIPFDQSYITQNGDTLLSWDGTVHRDWPNFSANSLFS